jgi:hypothetical protein
MADLSGADLNGAHVRLKGTNTWAYLT